MKRVRRAIERTVRVLEEDEDEDWLDRDRKEEEELVQELKLLLDWVLPS